MGILIEQLTVKYKHNISLYDINVTFGNYEQWAIYGPNGSGKSTLLKTIMGLIKPEQGSVLLSDIPHSRIAYLGQISEIDLTQPMNVFELVSLGLWYEISFYKGLNLKQQKRVYEALEQVELVHLATKSILELSRGQLQRVLFARMLVQEADFLLMDEPFNALDASTTDLLLNFIVRAQQNKKGMIVVIHDIDIIQKYFPYVFILDKKVQYKGLTSQIDLHSW